MTDLPRLELVPVTAPSVSETAETQLADQIPEPQDQALRKRRLQLVKSPSARSPSPAAQKLNGGDWSSFDRTASYRLPTELLDELEERLWRLRLPVGVTVAAALAHLLDEPDVTVGELVARAERAKPGRRPRPG